jgi:CrcB protein
LPPNRTRAHFAFIFIMMNYLWIAVGSALGGVLRFWLSGLAAQRFGEGFPTGTLLVNTTGSFLIGFIYTFTAATGKSPGSEAMRHFLMAGLCGGYTTFSAFSRTERDALRRALPCRRVAGASVGTCDGAVNITIFFAGHKIPLTPGAAFH